MRIMMLLLLAAVISPAFAARAMAAEGRLPEPKKTGGTPVFESIDRRGSAGQADFPLRNPTAEDVSTVLWAASGNNRNGGKWTVPMAMGRPPYCKIYLLSGDGAFLYDWKNHALVEVAGDNLIGTLFLQDAFKKAPMALIFVIDGEESAGFGSPIKEEAGPVLAGAMSQNVYLACGGLDIGTRVVYSIDRGKASSLLKLASADQPLFGMPFGKY